MTSRCARIGLGSAQWGMHYGVAKRIGRTTCDEVGKILHTAKAYGINVIDTASLYGEAETVLGEHDLTNFRVVTKTPRYAYNQITTAETEDLKATFSRSLAQLRVPSLYGLLVHHADDLLVPGGERIIDALHYLRAEGKVGRIGVSVYDGEQIKALLEKFTPDLVQLPLSVFDQRLINDGSINLLAAHGIEIHTRSAFVQGLILMDPDSVPPYFAPWREHLHKWRSACAAQNVLPQHAALSFVCDQPEVACCLVGVENSGQLIQLLTGLDAVATFDASELGSSDLALVNPVKWRLS